MRPDQRKAAAALLRTVHTPEADALGELFTRAGHELALVGGWVRDLFLGDQSYTDMDHRRGS